ncbi:hypothetical protein SDJN02_24971, partial [Cucurbita argyrosperma subsp. argyrosperma]
MPTFPLSVCPAVLPVPNPIENLTLGQENLDLTAEILPLNPTTPKINLNSKSTLKSGALSLNLSLPSNSANSSSKHPDFPGITRMSSGDNIISGKERCSSTEKELRERSSAARLIRSQGKGAVQLDR